MHMCALIISGWPWPPLLNYLTHIATSALLLFGEAEGRDDDDDDDNEKKSCSQQ